MNVFTKPAIREIINDFAEEIKKIIRPSTPPRTTVIAFRNELKEGIERKIFLVPIDLLRYRKDNGRIASDVIQYEKINGILIEFEPETQKVIKSFLGDKDKEKTEELEKAIMVEGQRDPAIITCDGFLINGNRRKMVMERLLDKYPGDEKYKYMKVVILPGKDDEDNSGGPPSILEIEEIENRYQLQKDVKAEYSALDKALTMRKKENFGMSLREQLRDDPVFASLPEKDFKARERDIIKNNLKPLECIDRYLDRLGRPGLYSTIARSSYGDPEGRWQAFLDYYNSTYEKIENPKKRMQLDLSEEDVGKVETVAFNIIRKRDLRGIGKLHVIMRNLHKYIENKDSRKELFKLKDIEIDIPENERMTENGEELDERDIDEVWGKKHEKEIIRQVKIAIDNYESKRNQETPIELLEVSLKKLNHENMKTNEIPYSQINKALKLCHDIMQRADELKDEFYKYLKNKKLLGK